MKKGPSEGVLVSYGSGCSSELTPRGHCFLGSIDSFLSVLFQGEGRDSWDEEVIAQL